MPLVISIFGNDVREFKELRYTTLNSLPRLYLNMEKAILILKIFGGLGLLILFVFLIFYSLDDKPSRFLKYLLSYLIFLVTIGFLFILFGEASLYVGLLAGIGWMVLVVVGSKGGKKSLPGSNDTKEVLDDVENN